MRLIWKSVKILLALVLTGLLLINLYFITARIWNNELCPKLWGYGRLIVASGSMEPELSAGDFIIVHQEPSYTVGEILTYRSNGVLITHRLVGLDGPDLICKGDANPAKDPPVAFRQVEGKTVLIIPGIGRFIAFCQTPPGFLALCVLGAALVIFPTRLLRVRERRRNL